MACTPSCIILYYPCVMWIQKYNFSSHLVQSKLLKYGSLINYFMTSSICGIPKWSKSINSCRLLHNNPDVIRMTSELYVVLYLGQNDVLPLNFITLCLTTSIAYTCNCHICPKIWFLALRIWSLVLKYLIHSFPQYPATSPNDQLEGRSPPVIPTGPAWLRASIYIGLCYVSDLT